MEEVVKVSWFMKGETPREDLEEFFKEYIDENYIELDDYYEACVEQTDEPVWIIQFSTLRSSYDWFMKEFGGVTTIREGWVF